MLYCHAFGGVTIDGGCIFNGFIDHLYTTRAFERAKTVHALDRSVTVIDSINVITDPNPVYSHTHIRANMYFLYSIAMY
jgi:hypothetical protein